jgi:hypothetical protein
MPLAPVQVIVKLPRIEFDVSSSKLRVPEMGGGAGTIKSSKGPVRGLPISKLPMIYWTPVAPPPPIV